MCYNNLDLDDSLIWSTDLAKTAHSVAVGDFDFYGKSTENIYMQLKPIELIWVTPIAVKAIFAY